MTTCKSKQFIKSIQNGLLSLTLITGAGSFITPIASAEITTTDFSALVSKVAPAVARVNVTKKISKEELEKVQTAELLRSFFGDRINIPESATIPAVEYSYGTAFFITKDGYLLTNHHVVEGAESITVTLSDRRELDATLIGSDERSDVAVLKVKGTNLPALPIGNSEKIKVGEPVLAIGSPFGFDYSASAGIVSAKSRNFSQEVSVPFIQTDVALNPGNSGGPLFNKHGEVIGINSRIFSGTGGYMGLSFSIPISEAMEIYEQLRKDGKVSRAYIGLYSQDIDRNLAEAFGLEKPQGALLSHIVEESPADIAGLKSGDVVLKYNNESVKSAGDLMNHLNRAHPNDTFNLLVQRKGKKIKITGKFDSVVPNDIQTDQNNDIENRVYLGLRLRALSSEYTKELQETLPISGGLLITAVDPTGISGRSGLQAGDIITNLNHHPITDIDSFSKAHDDLPKKGVVTVEIIRQGVPAIVGLRIE